MSYDSKCHDLAEHFLTGDGRPLAVVDPTGKRIRDLAQRIQTSIEDWFDEEEAAMKADAECDLLFKRELRKLGYPIE